MPIPVELHDLAFGIANSKSSSKSTRRVQLRGAHPPICKQTGKRYGFVRQTTSIDGLEASFLELTINQRIGKGFSTTLPRKFLACTFSRWAEAGERKASLDAFTGGGGGILFLPSRLGSR